MNEPTVNQNCFRASGLLGVRRAARARVLFGVPATLLMGATSSLCGQQVRIHSGPDLRVEVREQRYALAEETLRGVVDTLNMMHVGGSDAPISQGVTDYTVRPHWRARASDGMCRVSELVVWIEVTITLPEWPLWSSRPKRERDSWQRFDEAIRGHEYGHRDLVVDGGRDLLRDLSGLEANECNALRRIVSAIVSRADMKLREEHAAFDQTVPPILFIG